MRRIFPSLSNSEKYAYAYDSDKFMDRRSTIESRFRMYETGGHGLVQHSEDWPILKEQLTDYLWSLAAILPGDEELLQSVSFLFNQGVDVKTIEFAATKIVAKDNPEQRYYNLRERTIKKNPRIAISQKEHWKQVPDWADGSAKAIFRLITPEYADGLDRYGIACALHQWCFAEPDDRPWMTDAGRFLEWFKDHEDSRRLESAYYTCKWACESYRLSESVKRSLENHKDWLERKRTAA